MFDKFRERFFSDKEGDFDRGGDINAETTKRNQHITSVIVLFLVLAVLGVYQYTRPKTVKEAPTTAVEFGAIVDKGFTEKDNQSALTQQQMLIATLTKEMRDLKGKMQGFKKRPSSVSAAPSWIRRLWWKIRCDVKCKARWTS
uniref:IncF plasmid conjugative transfer pilus assemblyprotein TraB n=1 Tax=Vibrio splendidus TaxID=29497 RepID=A0A0H3ZYP0_VIBSP|nr:IncF plasmid conjugative transfer pilus assemblyprotein TraB [Vibrio splendidus]